MKLNRPCDALPVWIARVMRCVWGFSTSAYKSSAPCRLALQWHTTRSGGNRRAGNYPVSPTDRLGRAAWAMPLSRAPVAYDLRLLRAADFSASRVFRAGAWSRVGLAESRHAMPGFADIASRMERSFSWSFASQGVSTSRLNILRSRSLLLTSACFRCSPNRLHM
jgi:hypothetical protein